MKHVVRLLSSWCSAGVLVIVLGLSLLLASCDWWNDQVNGVTIDGRRYALAEMDIEYYGPIGTGESIRYAIRDDGIFMEYDEPDHFYGAGTYATLNVISAQREVIDDDYPFNATAVNPPALILGTIYLDAVIEYDGSVLSVGRTLELNAGTLDVREAFLDKLLLVFVGTAVDADSGAACEIALRFMGPIYQPIDWTEFP
jgi:hypothetical protein